MQIFNLGENGKVGECLFHLVCSLISFSFFKAIHVNYDAKFTCDSIKMAVIKNRWLAQRLGGDMYSVVFKYEQGNMNSV